MRLAVDVMGGDHAPNAIVEGCLDALDQLDAGDQLIMVGDQPIIEKIMRKRGVSDSRIVIEHASEVIEMHESPVEAVRAKKDSSLVKMILLGSSRKTPDPVDVVITAGNTGACVSAATMFMKRLPGAHRPGIACMMPSFHGPVVLCDVGANPEPRPSHLVQYAVMADVYSRRVLGVKSPRVAQLNIGSEEAKGTGLVKQVRDLLQKVPGMNYIGYIEGRDLFQGAADVVVTDGFVGNTVLKLSEGLAKSLFSAMAHEFTKADPKLAAQLGPILKGLIKKNDYHELGGAPLLGANGACMICHGSSESRTITNTIRVAREFVQADVNHAIIDRLAELERHLGAAQEVNVV